MRTRNEAVKIEKTALETYLALQYLSAARHNIRGNAVEVSALFAACYGISFGRYFAQGTLRSR